MEPPPPQRRTRACKLEEEDGLQQENSNSNLSLGAAGACGRHHSMDDSSSVDRPQQIWLPNISHTPVLPLPPLFPAPVNLPLYRYPCHETCSGWMQTKSLVSLITPCLLPPPSLRRRINKDEDEVERIIDDEDMNQDDQTADDYCIVRSPFATRLTEYRRLWHLGIERELRKLDANPLAVTNSITASQHLRQGANLTGVCSLLPQLVSEILRELHTRDVIDSESTTTEPESEAHPHENSDAAIVRHSTAPTPSPSEDTLMEDVAPENAAAATSATSSTPTPLDGSTSHTAAATSSTPTPTHPRSSSQMNHMPTVPTTRFQMHLTLVRILGFLLRDAHYSQAFLARGIDAEAILQWLVDKISLSNFDASRYDESKLSEQAELLNHIFQLFSNHQLSWSYFFAFLPTILTACQSCILHLAESSTPTAFAIRVLLQLLHFLGTVWSRGFQFFLLHALARESRQLHSSPMDTQVVHLYQQCVSMITRFDWTAKLISLSTVKSSSDSTFIATINKYANHLIQIWPHPQLFHRFVLPINGVGLLPLVDAAHSPPNSFATSKLILPPPTFSGPTSSTSLPSSPSIDLLTLHKRACAMESRRKKARKEQLKKPSSSKVSSIPSSAVGSRLRGGEHNAHASSTVARSLNTHPVELNFEIAETSPSSLHINNEQVTKASSSSSLLPNLHSSVGITRSNTHLNYSTDKLSQLVNFDPIALQRSSPLSEADRQRVHALLAQAAVTTEAMAFKATSKIASQIRHLLTPELQYLRQQLQQQVNEQMANEILANHDRARQETLRAFHEVNRGYSSQGLQFYPLTRHIPSNLATVVPLPTTKPDESDGGGMLSVHDPRLNPLHPPTHKLTAPKDSQRNQTQFAGVPSSIGLEALLEGVPLTAPGQQQIYHDWNNQIKQHHHKRSTATVTTEANSTSFTFSLDEQKDSTSGSSVHQPQVTPLLAESSGFQQALPSSTFFTLVRANVPKEDETSLDFVPYFGDETKVDQIIDVSLYSNLFVEGEVPASAAATSTTTPTKPKPSVKKSASSTPDSSVSDDIGSAHGSAATGGSTAGVRARSEYGRSRQSYGENRRKRRRQERDQQSDHEDAAASTESPDMVTDSLLRYLISTYGSKPVEVETDSAPDLLDESAIAERMVLSPIILQLLSESSGVSYRLLKRRLRALQLTLSSTAHSLPIHSIPSNIHQPLDSFEKIWCRRCYVYDCPNHGFNQPRAYGVLRPIDYSILDPRHDVSPYPPRATPIHLKRIIPDEATLLQLQRKKEARLIARGGSDSKIRRRSEYHEKCGALETTEFEYGTPCSKDCFLTVQAKDKLGKEEEKGDTLSIASTESAGSWTIVEKNMLRQLYFVAMSVLNDEFTLPPKHIPNLLKSSSKFRAKLARHKQLKRAKADYGQPGENYPESEEEDVHDQEVAPSVAPLPCRLTKLLGSHRTCSEVADYCRMIEPHMVGHGVEELLQALEAEAEAVAEGSFEEEKSPSADRMSKVDFADRLKTIAKQYVNLALHFRPCDHPGKDCSSQCPCAASEIFCEPSCGCKQSCPNRYRGCRCTGSRCQTKACPCFQAQRECDPDLCRTCGAEKELDVTLRQEIRELEATSETVTPRCANVFLRSGRKLPLILGRSNIHGWGCYARIPLEKDRQITEYVGELISHEEADRRGKIYDHHNRSYLFNLNDELVVDAAKKGNKVRFANHAEKEHANCYPRIIAVNGEHRIVMIAKRRIMTGEELFFDYAHDHDQTWNDRSHAPTWFKRKEEDSTPGSSSTSAAAASHANRKGAPPPLPSTATSKHATSATATSRSRSKSMARTRTKKPGTTSTSQDTITSTAKDMNQSLDNLIHPSQRTTNHTRIH